MEACCGLRLLQCDAGQPPSAPCSPALLLCPPCPSFPALPAPGAALQGLWRRRQCVRRQQAPKRLLAVKPTRLTEKKNCREHADGVGTTRSKDEVLRWRPISHLPLLAPPAAASRRARLCSSRARMWHRACSRRWKTTSSCRTRSRRCRETLRHCRWVVSPYTLRRRQALQHHVWVATPCTLRRREILQRSRWVAAPHTLSESQETGQPCSPAW